MKLTFIVPGDPKAEPRHKSSIIAGRIHTYEPAAAKVEKGFIKFLAVDAMKKAEWVKSELPIKLNITAFIALTKSDRKNKKIVEKVKKGVYFPTKKPDVDNIAKLYQDAMNDLVYVDDKQIVESTVKKQYTLEAAYTLIEVEELWSITV